MYPQEPAPAAPISDPSQNNSYGSQNPPAIDPQHPINNPLSVMAPGEQIICEVRRHPIGILGIYVITGLLLVVLAVLAFIVAPNVITSASRGQVTVWGALIFLLVSVVGLGFVFVAHTVYWGNSWVVTSDSITQITQISLFSKQSSQLSLGNLEDVSAEQHGILQHMFNYGVLRVETAGERSKFLFPFCPNPSYYAKQVLGAREAFEQGRGNEDQQRLYRQEGAYPPPPTAYAAPYQAPIESVPGPAPPTFSIPNTPEPPNPPSQPTAEPEPLAYPTDPVYSPPPPAYPAQPASEPSAFPTESTSYSPYPATEPPAYPPADPVHQASSPTYPPEPASQGPQPTAYPTEPAQTPDYGSYAPPPTAYPPLPDNGVNVTTD